jgi:hypothetical protein
MPFLHRPATIRGLGGKAIKSLLATIIGLPMVLAQRLMRTNAMTAAPAMPADRTGCP